MPPTAQACTPCQLRYLCELTHLRRLHAHTDHTPCKLTRTQAHTPHQLTRAGKLAHLRTLPEPHPQIFPHPSPCPRASPQCGPPTPRKSLCPESAFTDALSAKKRLCPSKDTRRPVSSLWPTAWLPGSSGCREGTPGLTLQEDRGSREV